MDPCDETLFAEPTDREYDTYRWGWGAAGLAGPLMFAGALAAVIAWL